MVDRRRSPIPAAPGALPRPAIALLDVVAAASACVLVYATHHSRPEELIGPTPPNDKTLHFLAYLVLGVTVTAAFAARGGWSARAGFALLVLLGLFAAADEATQPLVGRHADRVDWAFDGVGLLVGIALVTAIAIAWTRRVGGRQ